MIIMQNSYDIVIIGAGPAGMSFACEFAAYDLNILIIEKQTLDNIANPKLDGREIALTHLSKHILTKINVWQLIDKKNISFIKAAQVLDEGSNKTLNFSSKKIDEIGYLVGNYHIRKALFTKINTIKNITILSETTVINLINNNNHIKLNLSNNKTITTKLLIAADSRFSALRRQMGINSIMHDFAKTMICVNVQLAIKHDNIAIERFDYDKTVALLPMNDNKASFVLTVDDKTKEKWLAMSKEEFSSNVSNIFANKFGIIKQIGSRYAYPLIGVHAKRFIAHRFALIGDAAVGMHPVTAHGFNLGLKGNNILATLIKSAVIANKDIASDKLLKKYQQKHMTLTKIMYFGTNIVIGIFTKDNAIAKPIRKLAINLTDALLPVKKAILHHLSSIKQ